jgi:hypothetical protein
MDRSAALSRATRSAAGSIWRICQSMSWSSFSRQRAFQVGASRASCSSRAAAIRGLVIRSVRKTIAIMTIVDLSSGERRGYLGQSFDQRHSAVHFRAGPAPADS